ncbi:MAG: hypothetical protein MUP97_07185 [Acidimicrobiia bacterium]|nr:hypothetical protein [Acidimicrobiia bacterium]
MDPSIGPLVPADETLLHQTVDTFASVGPNDVNWTEKIWLQACARDGSLQVLFGLGKYTNRNVIDAFGGVSRGTEQWTVRASRALHTDPMTAEVGPLRYDIVEPLGAVRVRLDATDVQPIAFDLTIRGVVPPRMEDRELHRSPHANRVVNDVVRYHQTGVVDGWIEVEDTRVAVTPDAWVGTRDHSWGVRMQVGDPLSDLEPPARIRDPRSFTSWAPWLMERTDGSRYALFHYFMESNLPGAPTRRVRGGVEHPDGTEEPFVDARFDVAFDDTNRRFLGGEITFVTEDGTERPVSVTPFPSGTGFHLGTGLYFGLDGARHGQWRGELHVDGDHSDACDTREVARHIHQHRDCVVRVEDPVGGGVGWGSVQTIVIGAFPEFGLRLESTFV